MAKKIKRRKPKSKEALPIVHGDAAGIDIGADEHYVAVPADRDVQPVRSFKSFTKGLHALADWLGELGVTTVAMESTGVYWVPLYEILEERGIEACLVNAKHVRNVPGRKTDVLDCQWLQRLHAAGLLRASFRPTAEFVTLRSYLRQRESLMKNATTQVQHMHKALTLMNVQIQRVIADITGKTGMAIVRAIVAGERDPARLAQHRDPRCRASVETIEASLSGHYQPEHIFTLQQALQLYDQLQAMIGECDRRIDAQLDQIRAALPEIDGPPPPKRKRKKSRSKEFLPDIHDSLYAITGGVDLTVTSGLGDLTVLQIIAEIGTDMSAWPTAKHFASWAALAPSSRVTGGKSYKTRRPYTATRVAQILRLAALNAGRTSTAIGAFYRRKAGSIGKGKAIVATANKLARIIYTLLKRRTPYNDPGADAYEQRYRERAIRALKRRADALGYQVIAEQSSPQEAIA